MQIKERGSKTVFLRFEYNPEKKRTENRSIGTQDKYLHTLSDELAAKMNEAEQREAQAWLRARKDMQEKNMSKARIVSLPGVMTGAIKAMENEGAMAELSEAEFNAVYHAWAELAEAMRNAGFKRPRSKSVK